MTDAPLLQVEDLNLKFHLYEGVSHVLNGVAMHVRGGERVALVGESGCGKSVFVRTVLGLLARRNVEVSGRIRYHGEDLFGLSDGQRRELRGRKITMIFQDPSAALNPVFTIAQQMTEVIRRGNPSCRSAEALDIARQSLLQVAIDEPDRVLKSYPFQLSGGMNQRVVITMALVNRPELVLADEPGTSLDVTVQEQTLQLMTRLTHDAGAAVLLIAHNLGVVREFAERVYVMYAGTVVEEGTVEEVFRDPLHPYTKALFEAVPRLTGGAMPRAIEGMVPDYTRAPEGCRFHPRCPHATERCKVPPPNVTMGPGRRVRCILHEGEAEEAVHG
ncbi:MAG: ABC transporter ATP-binding protein [Rhodospirillales bacterium]|nr:ABC transporter ATP-binding protein [Rhodospirillales bacterium]